MHVVITVIFGQVDQDSCSAAAVPGPAEAAVADAPARRAAPLLTGEVGRPDESRLINTQTHHIKRRRNLLSYRIQQSISDLLSVTVPEAGATELAPDPNALRVPTVGLGVGCFLAALVASGSLKKNKIKSILFLKTHSLVTNASTGLKQRGTHCGAVVHFLSHVVADVLQLRLCDVIHRSYHMKNSPGTVEGSTAGLEITHIAAQARKRLWKPEKEAVLLHLLTYWLIIFLVVAAFADQAELVLGLLLWSWAGRSLHQGARPCVRPGCTPWVPPEGSWSSRGLPRRLAWLFQGYQLVQTNTACAIKKKTKQTHVDQKYRRGHRHASWEESWDFVQLCHELCKLPETSTNDCQNQGRRYAGAKV